MYSFNILNFLINFVENVTFYVDNLADSSWGSSLFKNKVMSCDTPSSCRKQAELKSKRIESIPISINSHRASTLINKIRENNEDGIIALKINAEGGEYPIIQDLLDGNAFCKVDFLFVALHMKQMKRYYDGPHPTMVSPVVMAERAIKESEKIPNCKTKLFIDSSCDLGGKNYGPLQVDALYRKKVNEFRIHAHKK